jgi:DedD protein
MADNDAQVELKKRARRRLVGAIALALAAAIVLPMVMDSEPKPGSNELQIRIPSQEGGNFASRLITGAAQPPTAPRMPAVQPASSAPLEKNTPQSVESEAAANLTEPVSEPAQKPSIEAVKSAQKPELPKAPAVTKPSSEDARARSILEGAEEKTSKAQFFVQLGVYRDESNAHEVLGKAKAQGVKASTEKLGDKTRVRVGPFSERSAAEAAAAKLKKAGISGIVTAK